MGYLVDGSPPGLARKVRNSPAMVGRVSGVVAFPDHLPVWSRFRTISRFPDQGGLTTVCEMIRKRDHTDSSEEQMVASDHRR